VSASLPAGIRIIDAHTHLFAPEVVADRRRHLERDAWFGELYASPDIVLVSPEDLIDSMDRAGIAVSIVCGWPWQDPGLCREHNDFLAEVHRQYPDRIAWLAIVNPVAPEAPAEIERAAAMGACGVGEVNADAQRFDWEQPTSLGAAVEACFAANIPLMLHSSEPVGHRYLGKGTATPDRLLRFIEAYQDLRIVAAHWGGGLPFYELMPEVAALTQNVTYDTAASTYLYRFDVFPAVERLIGHGRVALGSDYPLLKQTAFLKRVLDSGLPDDAIRGVLGETAARVYRLDDRKFPQ
jgi:uncharacterized protein